jgi:hypothetical protein
MGRRHGDEDEEEDTVLLCYAFEGGPIRTLVSLGADVYALDADGESVWSKMSEQNDIREVMAMCTVGVLVSAEQMRRLASRSALRWLPKEMTRMVADMLVVPFLTEEEEEEEE